MSHLANIEDIIGVPLVSPGTINDIDARAIAQGLMELQEYASAYECKAAIIHLAGAVSEFLGIVSEHKGRPTSSAVHALTKALHTARRSL